MIGECLDGEREFGIIWLSDDGLKEVGCAARITRVLERFDDGRLNILVEGTEPFRLTRKIEDLPYPAGDIEPLPDEGEKDQEALERARSRYADLVEEVTETRPEPDALAELDAYGMAATLEVAPAAKQALLELRLRERPARAAGAALRGGPATDQDGRACRGARQRQRAPQGLGRLAPCGSGD